MIEDIITNMLLTNHTWYGSFLLNIDRRENKDIPTLRTCFEENNLAIEYNPDFLKKLTLLQQIAIV